MADIAASTPVQADSGAFAFLKSHAEVLAKGPFQALPIDAIDTLSALAKQASGIAGLLRHVDGPDLSVEALQHTGWLLQDMLEQMQEILMSAESLRLVEGGRHD